MTSQQEHAGLPGTVTAGWTEEQRAALAMMLSREATRRRVLRDHPTVGSLARSIDPNTVQTPALDVIDAGLEYVYRTRDARLLVTVPPQEGKSSRISVWSVIRALQADPDRRIVLVSYAEELARSHSRTARNIIREYGSAARDPITGLPQPDRLGLALADDKSAASNWRIAGHRGGLFVGGITSGITGHSADILVIDDPLKGLTEADSKVERQKVIQFWNAVAQTRLAPGAPVIIIQTRWHEEDLAGYVLAEDAKLPPEEREWVWINVPAVARPGVPDALHRLERGLPAELQSALGDRNWARTERAVGPRVWSALYQGMPTPERGGLFDVHDFDRYRLDAIPDAAPYRLVSIDPAEKGDRDEAGIIALSGTADGRVYVTADRSGLMQSDEWARAAVILALRTDAQEVMFEAYTTETTYQRVILQAWKMVRREAQALRAAGGDYTAAAAAVSGWPDAPEDPAAHLADLAGLVVPDQDAPPFRIHPHRGKGDKVARAAGTRQAVSTGRLRLVGTFPTLEAQASQWQQGHKDSPDRMDALVHGYERVVSLSGSPAVIAVPGAGRNASRRAGSAWSRRTVTARTGA